MVNSDSNFRSYSLQVKAGAKAKAIKKQANNNKWQTSKKSFAFARSERSLTFQVRHYVLCKTRTFRVPSEAGRVRRWWRGGGRGSRARRGGTGRGPVPKPPVLGLGPGTVRLPAGLPRAARHPASHLPQEALRKPIPLAL